MDAEGSVLKARIKKLLADFLGVEVEDINPEDLLSDDLHMTPADLTDFAERLKSEGIDISDLDLAQTETFEDMTEALTDHT